MSKVKLNDVIKALDLEVIYGNSFLKNGVGKAMSSRPSVELYAGYFDYFEKDRIQVIGTKELTIFNMLSLNQKKERLEKMFSYKSPAYVFTKNVDAPKEFVEAAIANEVPLLKSKSSTSGFIGELTNYLQSKLAERKVIDGSMLEIFGIGVLIQGRDGIGKSETALKLLKNGHILIADDKTQIYQPEPGEIVCESPKHLQSLMTIKDLGLINVEQVFGIRSIRHHKKLQLVIKLVDELEEAKEEQFFDTSVPKIVIQMEAGRNIATLIETAALNYRLRLMGKDATKEYENRIKHTILKEI